MHEERYRDQMGEMVAKDAFLGKAASVEEWRTPVLFDKG